MKAHKILLQLLLIFCLINAESTISEINRHHVDGSKSILLLSKDRFLIWDKLIVLIDNQIIYRESEGQIINVISNSDDQNPAAAIITSDFSQEKPLSIRILDNNGKTNLLPQINRPLDTGIPKILILNQKLLLMRPENQQIQFYHIDGSLSDVFDLFVEKSWDHEKQIFSTRDVQHNLYLLGMKSADLNNSLNVSLFKMENKPIWLLDIPLTVPYYFSMSNKNMIAIVGTIGVSNTYEQVPILIFLDQNQQNINEPVELKKLPQKTLWVGDKYFLIYRDRIIIYSSEINRQPNEIKFNSPINPFEAFAINESVFIVSSREIGADQEGNFYSSIDLVEFNQTTHSISSVPLQDGPIRKVEYFPSGRTNDFYLRLDSQLVQFRIAK
ncbi:MAG: hypothetical protein ACE5D0_10260 [Fidelibacterota bacterium]